MKNIQPMFKEIDSHHHLWNYSAAEYPWIGKGMDAIRRDFRPEDIHLEMQRAGIHGSVAVQARQSLEETESLLHWADRYDFLLGVVGWLPLTSRSLDEQLKRFSAHPKLKAVRHVLHDEADDFYMLRDDFNAGVAQLKRYHLAYDILIFEKHLPQTIQFVDRHPSQIFVVDHIAKPRIRDQQFSPWRELLKELSRRDNVYCKLSGVVTEADWRNWHSQHVQAYMDIALDAFGPKRMLFGSDWPVLLVASSYSEWVDTVRNCIGELTASERESIMGGTAAGVYRLDTRTSSQS
jgi:L-fuconolactonase